MLKTSFLFFCFLFSISDIKPMLWWIWSYLEKRPINVENAMFPYFSFQIWNVFSSLQLPICNKLKWKVFPIMLETQPKISPLKNVMSWQNWRILRSRTLGQLPSMCIFYNLSLCEHILYFMKDVKIYSIASVLHLYFILHFHYVTLILHTVHILIWRQIMNLLVKFSCFSHYYLSLLIKLPDL